MFNFSCFSTSCWIFFTMTEFWDKPAEKSGKVLAAFLEGLPLYRTAWNIVVTMLVGQCHNTSQRLCREPFDLGREWLMDYRGPGFPAIVWFGYSSPPPSTSELMGDAQEDWERETTCLREGGYGRANEPNHTTTRKPGPLYCNTSNTPWS